MPSALPPPLSSPLRMPLTPAAAPRCRRRHSRALLPPPGLHPSAGRTPTRSRFVASPLTLATSRRRRTARGSATSSCSRRVRYRGTAVLRTAVPLLCTAAAAAGYFIMFLPGVRRYRCVLLRLHTAALASVHVLGCAILCHALCPIELPLLHAPPMSLSHQPIISLVPPPPRAGDWEQLVNHCEVGGRAGLPACLSRLSSSLRRCSWGDDAATGVAT